MNVQQMQGNALIDDGKPQVSTQEYLAVVEEFDDLWSAEKCDAGQRRMDALMAIMLRYEGQRFDQN
jgi:hypothetical protein